MSQGAETPRFGRGYMGWAMALLLAIYTSNFVDRQVLSVLQQPIKEELKLTDGQLGLLQGFAFAIFYSILGIPIARLAERRSRKTIIAVSVLVWSAMTALCGTAGSFATLFLFRVGVGVGEAGASPPAHSMIADYYPPQKRATALSIYSLGIPLGSLLGAVLGGLVAQRYGWRPAFFVVGLPGVVLAVLSQFTLREPPRGHSEAVGTRLGDLVGDGLADVEQAAPSFGAVVRRLLSKPAFLHLAAGATLASFAGYGVNAFAAPYYIRMFGLTLAQVGLVFGVVAGVGAGVGVLAGGVISDRAGQGDRRWYAWAPAIGLLVGAPLYITAFLLPSWQASVALLFVAGCFTYTYLGPAFGVMHNMVTPRMRATATALLFLIINLIGLGLGPTVVGLLSDAFAGHVFQSSAMAAQGSFHALCPGGRPAADAVAALAPACHKASATGVRWAIVIGAVVYVWAAAHYALAARTLRRDLEP